MAKKNTRKSQQNFTITLIIGLIALSLSSGYALSTAKKLTIAKLSAPPTLEIGGMTLQGYLTNQKGLLRFYKQDEINYGQCKDPVDFLKGVHAYYSTKDLTLQNWFEKVMPQNSNEILFAYYNSDISIESIGWHTYPKGPYNDDSIKEIEEKDLANIHIPKNTGIIFMSKNAGKFCNAKGIIKSEKDFLTTFDPTSLQKINNGWVLIPTTANIKTVVDKLKTDHMIKSIYNLYQSKTGQDFRQDQEMDLITLKRPENALSIAWINLDKKPLGEGEVYVNYPTVQTSAKKGDMVFIPIAKIFETEEDIYSKYWDLDGLYSSFFAAQMMEPGEKESKVKIEGIDIVTEIEADTFIVPNSLIIPIKPNQTAKIGDFILTKYQGGKEIMQGWVTAIVLESNSYTKPKVNFVSLLPSDVVLKTDEDTTTLEESSFHKLSGIVEPGGNVLHKKEGKQHMLKVINTTESKALLVNAEGYLEAYNLSDLTPIPVTPKLGTGEIALAPTKEGVMREVTVTQWWPEKGKIEAEYTLEGKKETGIFLYGEVMPVK